MSFEKILIANRGEIACRVIRTARALGYRTVAVYSDADRAAPHVELADEAVHLGASPAASSYLSIERVLDAARRSGAQAIHPGYGFLSERPDFAQACVDAGLVFIGPPASAILAMGNKVGAKRRMLTAKVPCAPGYLGDEQSDDVLTAKARELGLPLLVKAVAGGGGRGMRLVRSFDELAAAIAGARREALSAFGDGTLMLERLIEGGRHIEIQVFADAHGHAIHLGERDCTAQRRRQKVIEEAPSPVVDEAMRRQMGSDAVAAALAVGYQGAGTVEFIVDADLKHYFLEMNTRLQVEHPVTECITGLDLVEWQLRVAAGEPLPLTQEQVRFDGHAIEVRLYAEDPYQGFAPQTGQVLYWRPDLAVQGRDGDTPAVGRAGYVPGAGRVRIDSGIREGNSISPFYDPMVAKLIAHGRDRSDAIRRLRALIEDAPLIGLRNNASYLRDLLATSAFARAELHTNILDQWLEQGHALYSPRPADAQTWAIAAAVLAFEQGTGQRPASVAAWDLELVHEGEKRRLRVQARSGVIEVTDAQGAVEQIDMASYTQQQLRYRHQGVERRAVCVREGADVHLVMQGTSYRFAESSAYPAADRVSDPRQARAPVAGTVSALAVKVGDTVEAHQALICVEAMKMEMWLHAGQAGRVSAIHAQLQDSVEAGALLVELELAPSSAPD